MKKILIPTDFSDNARNAFDYAIELFGAAQEYILFNSYEEPRSTAASMVSLRDILQEASEDSLAEERAFFLQRYEGLNIEVKSIYGDPTQSVVALAEKEEVDAIVMGTAGESGIVKLFLGSTASAVIESADCPVFVVPKEYRFTSLKNVLLAADLKPDEEGSVPELLIELVQGSGGEVTILTVNAAEEEIDQERAEKGFELHSALKGLPHRFDVVSGDDVGDTIRSYAHDNGMQLLVTRPRKTSWFDRLLHPSVSKDLAAHLEVPMLAIH